jgi:hypothetical protein
MSSIGMIAVQRPGERANQLVRCLQANAEHYSVGIEHDPEAIMIVDKGGHAGDMPKFLRERLDVCSRELRFDWRDYLAVKPSLDPSLVESGKADALKRLDTALVEQHRSIERHDAATGQSDHLVAEVALHKAAQQVAAREAWLKWVGDESYRGLNAGPFELLAECREARLH